MSWSIFFGWLYVVVGELVALLVLDDEVAAAEIRSLEQKGRYAPYRAAIMVVLAWPAVGRLLQSLSKSK